MHSYNSNYLPAIDHLRALAAILVIFQHCYVFIGAYFVGVELLFPKASNPVEAVLIEGHTGVALFLVLSGFIFTQITEGRQVRYPAFLLNRVLRIYPLMIAVFIAGSVYEFSTIRQADLLAVLAIPFQIVGPLGLWFVPEINPFTTLFWTLSTEFQFYLAFPLLLVILRRFGLASIAMLITAAFLFRLLVVSMGFGAHGVSYFTIAGRIDQFLLGMAAAVIHRSLPPSRFDKYVVLVSLIFMALLLFAYNREGSQPHSAGWKIVWPTAEGIVWAAFIIGYLRVCVYIPSLLGKFLAAVGETSYSIYLLHFTVLSAVLAVGPLTFGHGPSGAALLNCVLLVIPITLAVSWLTFRIIERPFLRLRVRYLGAAASADAPNDSFSRRECA